jgi:hypothetical protein
MASTIKNSLTAGGTAVPTLVTKLNRGRHTNLGILALAGDVVTFSISEPTFDSNGWLLIQVAPGVSLGSGTFSLECSIDQGASWFTFPAVTTAEAVFVFGLTGQPGGDTATVFAAKYQIGGFGGGALFRFGFVVAPTSGSSAVWALIG